MRELDKVTCLITRTQGRLTELLLFRHPNAGIQIPAGSVEMDERPDQAALREGFEESGLAGLEIVQKIGVRLEPKPANQRVVALPARVYARPDERSFNWASLPRGITVELLQSGEEYSLVSYVEGDVYLEPAYITYQITGWVWSATLAQVVRRHFFHLKAQPGISPAELQVKTDQHIFHPFWCALNDLPEIVAPQNEWLDFVRRECGYKF